MQISKIILLFLDSKNNIIKLQQEFDWNLYNSKQIIFFVDQDLSYWLMESTHYDENIFVMTIANIKNNTFIS